MRNRAVLIIAAIFVLSSVLYFGMRRTPPDVETATATAILPTVIPTTISAHAPKLLPIGESELKKAIVSAGDYLIRQQLANGELSYQVNVLNNDRSSTPSYIRLMGGTGSLYTVCRVANDLAYCSAGDQALEHYLQMLLTDPTRFKGTCLYTNGACPLGGASATIDAIYRRWQATGSVMLGDQNLLSTAAELGYFIVSMRKPEGGFYHSFDPHFAGTVDANYVSPTFNGEAVTALMQLYEMTDNEFWLEQAKEVNDFMITQPVTEDYSHAAALAMFARLDSLGVESQSYAKQIADLIIAGEVRSLNPANSSISTETKFEALAELAQTLYFSKMDHAQLDHEIRTFITFVQARQLPENDCNFDLSRNEIQRYQGGVFNSCDDPSIRVDGVQHWVNGLTTYLEYQSLMSGK